MAAVGEEMRLGRRRRARAARRASSGCSRPAPRHRPRHGAGSRAARRRARGGAANERAPARRVALVADQVAARSGMRDRRAHRDHRIDRSRRVGRRTGVGASTAIAGSRSGRADRRRHGRRPRSPSRRSGRIDAGRCGAWRISRIARCASASATSGPAAQPSPRQAIEEHEGGDARARPASAPSHSPPCRPPPSNSRRPA